MPKRTDANQQSIIDALRQVGATVQDLSKVGRGCPDLLVGHAGVTRIIEVKTAKGKLTPDQERWHLLWRGQKAIVRTPEEALRCIGVIK